VAAKLKAERAEKQVVVKKARRDRAQLVEEADKKQMLLREATQVAKRKARAAETSHKKEVKATGQMVAAKAAEKNAAATLERKQKRRKLELQQARRSRDDAGGEDGRLGRMASKLYCLELESLKREEELDEAAEAIAELQGDLKEKNDIIALLR
jgi:hypothetical protein